MKKNIFYFNLFLIIFLHGWNTENSKNGSIQEQNNKNICGKFEGSDLDYISFNVGQVENILFYECPVDEKSNPRLRTYSISIVPSDVNPYVKQIIFNKKVQYDKEKWYEVSIIYSTNESKVLLLPLSTKISARDVNNKFLQSFEIPRLTNDGLLITHIKKEEKTEIKEKKLS